MQIQGSTLIVTGGCGGIGGAVVTDLLSHSANVVVMDIHDNEKGKQLVSSLAPSSAGKSLYIQTDITDQASCKAAFDQILSWTSSNGSKLVGLVHCAGIALRRPWTESFVDTIDGFEKMLRVNTLGTYVINAFAADAITSQYRDADAKAKQAAGSKWNPRADEERGVIINFASIAGHEPTGRNLGYGPTKTAVLGMTKSFSDFLGPAAIRVNTISPGIVASPMNTTGIEWFKKSLDAHAAFPRRPAGFDEVCSTVRFIFENGSLNAEDIKVTGGWRLVADYAEGRDPRDTYPGVE
ncbi:uncharacterized protein PFL1_02751 [Pseudozyma flocculosa PF-1]|uniref:Uncharacterized protein n=2 Tax=Pseudozyma flocculosa TaxID=84751 RepID=A0A5C3F0N0_9BASI|nr:uncharacterized protein PFL1_02751 [Pseudozyma flocculosa PF-1]EPQ29532.1 hypothetical protein PFL1_02751 [Pseudozyma flocculosa PF-1]SPO38074.1 uncharacterized protein PSFLO_03551 [Pseudozyma flocculosa]